MKGWLILSFTLAIGIALGVGAMTKGPALVAPYLPKSISGQSERIEGEVVRKQRDGNRLLVKVATIQGPMLVTFTQKVAELDLLLEAGRRDLVGGQHHVRNRISPGPHLAHRRHGRIGLSLADAEIAT